MALVTRSDDAGIDTVSASVAPQISGGPGEPLIAGEDLDAAAPCYIDPADGEVKMCDATAADAKAVLAGFTAKARKEGQPVTLHGIGSVFHYSDGDLTPGNVLFLAATAGRLDDGATTGDDTGVVQAISSSLVRVTRAI